MQKQDVHLSDRTYNLQHIFEPLSGTEFQQVLQSGNFERIRWDLSDQSTFILDKFPGAEGASCCFVRLPPDQKLSARFVVSGGHQLLSCPSGGWVLKSNDSTVPSYWIPQAPILRTIDSFGRILSEETASIVGVKTSSKDLAVEIETPDNMHLDLTVWCFHSSNSNILEELEHPLVLEKQSVFFWTSETTYQAPADLYLYLVHGQVYTNRFAWPRNLKFCSELDAYGLYVTLSGLELATGKMFYDLLKRQILVSVIARQAEDGAWYHGEWTDLMESHYRFHNGGMLLLEAALKEHPDELVSKALERAAHFISRKTDNIDLGLWFMHDTLEDSCEMMREMCRVNGSNWIQKPVLGKSATNKLIFNTHLDTLISLAHYREVTGDAQYAELVDSARDATRGMLALRPAEALYRVIYSAIKLTLLPKAEAEKLPTVLRAIKRITWKYITPNVYRIKNLYPRLVMPGGYIERHLGMGHYDINYHPINLMDLARFWRCFPDEDLAEIILEAIGAVSNSSILEYWAEAEPRHKSLVEWVDAMYHMCTLKQDASYRHLLAEGIIKIADTGIGLPPSLLGADPEAVKITQRIPCPSPTDSRIRVANLSCRGRTEMLVINPTSDSLVLTWEGDKSYKLSWTEAGGQIFSDSSQLQISPRSWLWGRQA